MPSRGREETRLRTILSVLLVSTLVLTPLALAGGGSQRVLVTGSAYAVSVGISCPPDAGDSIDCGTLQAAGFTTVTAAAFDVGGYEGGAFMCDAEGVSPLTSISVSFDTDGDGLGDVSYGGTTSGDVPAPTPHVEGTIPALFFGETIMSVYVEGGADITVTCAY